MIIYTKPNCPYCGYAKTLLGLHDIPYTESRLGVDHQLEDIQKVMPGWRTYPMIVNGKDFIGGYSDLQEYLEG
jgi:glutaredoxin